MQTVLQRTASAVTRTENSLRPILGAWRLPFRHGAAFVLMSGVKPQESFGCSPVLGGQSVPPLNLKGELKRAIL